MEEQMASPYFPVNTSEMRAQRGFLDVAEATLSPHFTGIHREIRRRHLFFHHGLQAADAPGRVKNKRILRVFVQRSKKRNSLNMVPVEVRDENVRRDRFPVRLTLQLLPEAAEARSAIKNIEVIAEAHLDARGVPSIAQVPGLRSRRRPAHSPELDPHIPPFE